LISVESLYGLSREEEWRNECIDLAVRDFPLEERRMNFARLLSVACLMMVSAVAFGQKVSYDFNKSVDFAQYKTYAWVDRGGDLKDELNHRRVVNAIDLQMASKGMTKVAAGARPDVLIDYKMTFSRSLNVSGYSSGFGGLRFAGGRTGSVRADNIVVATLSVEMIDAKSNGVVWRGLATKDVDMDASPEKREKNINKAAEKLLKNYPPGK
jgi:hypothetical protein